jgi:5-hmdU DNA kinase-like protein
MTLLPAGIQAREIRVAPGRVLQATPVFDTYWRFARARQQVFHKRVSGDRPPWTDDPVIANHRFTNAYRVSDRVSQFLVREVLYSGEQAPDEVFFRAILFKIFNRIDTWQALRARMGVISWRDYNFEAYATALDEIMARGSSIYSGAYIMPSPAMGHVRKHRNHLLLLEQMLRTEAPKKIAEAPSLEAVFRILLAYPSLGPFLAFQFTIDLNYSTLCSFSEMDYVVAGPGARDGIRKCFADTAGLTHEDVIRAVTERAADEFGRLDLHFEDLWGRSLQLIDCQNLFCEVDKYSRVMHPEFAGASGRTRIKQKFEPTQRPCPQWYPPKWNLHVPTAATPASDRELERPRRQSAKQLLLSLES